MNDDIGMDVIVRNRLREVCPVDKVEDYSAEEMEIAVRVAFKIIGYQPKDMKKAIRKAYETSADGHYWLCDFIFDVWRYDR